MVSLFSVRPNIFLGTCEGSTQYKKWYYEMMVDYVEPFVTAQATHLRVGWGMTEGYSPYPGGGEGWGGNGVGDDLYSYGFDGQHLWSGRDMLLTLVTLIITYSFKFHLILFVLWSNIQVRLLARWPLKLDTPLLLMMWSAAVWIWVCPVSPSVSMVTLFRACLRTSTWTASSSQSSASLLGSSRSTTNPLCSETGAWSHSYYGVF